MVVARGPSFGLPRRLAAGVMEDHSAATQRRED
jgi:hypothetical protein